MTRKNRRLLILAALVFLAYREREKWKRAWGVSGYGSANNTARAVEDFTDAYATAHGY